MAVIQPLFDPCSQTEKPVKKHTTWSQVFFSLIRFIFYLYSFQYIEWDQFQDNVIYGLWLDVIVQLKLV